MNDAPCMGSVKTVGDFDGERQEHVRLHGPPGNEVLESLTFKKLHGDEGLAGRLADLIDGADAGVIQCGSSLRFPLKTRQSVRIMRRLLRQKLQRDEAMQREVFGLVDNPHSAAAQLLDNAVMRDTLADHCRESYVGSAGKSMNTRMLVGLRIDCWREIAISLTIGSMRELPAFHAAPNDTTACTLIQIIVRF